MTLTWKRWLKADRRLALKRLDVPAGSQAVALKLKAGSQAAGSQGLSGYMAELLLA